MTVLSKAAVAAAATTAAFAAAGAPGASLRSDLLRARSPLPFLLDHPGAVVFTGELVDDCTYVVTVDPAVTEGDLEWGFDDGGVFYVERRAVQDASVSVSSRLVTSVPTACDAAVVEHRFVTSPERRQLVLRFGAAPAEPVAEAVEVRELKTAQAPAAAAAGGLRGASSAGGGSTLPTWAAEALAKFNLSPSPGVVLEPSEELVTFEAPDPPAADEPLVRQYPVDTPSLPLPGPATTSGVEPSDVVLQPVALPEWLKTYFDIPLAEADGEVEEVAEGVASALPLTAAARAVAEAAPAIEVVERPAIPTWLARYFATPVSEVVEPAIGPAVFEPVTAPEGLWPNLKPIVAASAPPPAIPIGSLAVRELQSPVAPFPARAVPLDVAPELLEPVLPEVVERKAIPTWLARYFAAPVEEIVEPRLGRAVLEPVTEPVAAAAAAPALGGGAYSFVPRPLLDPLLQKAVISNADFLELRGEGPKITRPGLPFTENAVEIPALLPGAELVADAAPPTIPAFIQRPGLPLLANAAPGVAPVRLAAEIVPADLPEVVERRAIPTWLARYFATPVLEVREPNLGQAVFEPVTEPVVEPALADAFPGLVSPTTPFVVRENSDRPEGGFVTAPFAAALPGLVRDTLEPPPPTTPLAPAVPQLEITGAPTPGGWAEFLGRHFPREVIAAASIASRTPPRLLYTRPGAPAGLDLDQLAADLVPRALSFVEEQQ